MHPVCTPRPDGHPVHMERSSKLGVLRGPVVLLLAVLVAAGCGDDDAVTIKIPDEPRTITAPTADEDLSEALGEEGVALEQAGCSFGSFDVGKADHIERRHDFVARGTF